jgi:hypothetical protein
MQEKAEDWEDLLPHQGWEQPPLDHRADADARMGKNHL